MSDARVVVVTGAAGCLGEAIGEALAASGYRVAAWDLDSGALQALAERHPDWFTQVCDLTDPAQAAGALAQTVARCGRIDALVNNAGLIHSELLFNLMGSGERRHSFERWRRVLDANLTTAFVATSHVAEHMIAGRIRGTIVNISSIAAQGNAGQSAYAAAKAGIDALTVTWAKELGSLGIRVVAIAPGFVDTASTRAAMTEAVLADWVRKTPLRRLGSPQRVADAVLFALRNDDLTGTTLSLDGGLRI